MIKITSDDLRRIADAMDNAEKYNNMCGIAYIEIIENCNGKKTLQFEQPCQYADCNSVYYRIKE